MNPPSPANDSAAPLTAAQRETLAVLVDMLVPPSADGRMPGAGEMPLLVQLVAESQAGRPAVRSGLEWLDAQATARHGAAFAALDAAIRSVLLAELAAREPAAVQQLALATVTEYYQQDEVLQRLGMEPRPPYPNGYQVLAGDLTLLGPVRARGTICRDAGDA